MTEQFDGSHTDRNMRERRTEENYDSFNLTCRSEVKINPGSFLGNGNDSNKNVDYDAANEETKKKRYYTVRSNATSGFISTAGLIDDEFNKLVRLGLGK